MTEKALSGRRPSAFLGEPEADLILVVSLRSLGEVVS